MGSLPRYSRLYYNKVNLLPAAVNSSAVNQIRFKASSASAINVKDNHLHHRHLNANKVLGNDLAADQHHQPSASRPLIDLTFNNTKECYKSKKTSELMRALIVLKLCSYPLIVDNNQKLIKVGQKVLGRRLFRLLMKSTFYGHFVAGENEKDMRPTIEHLRTFGVKSIFDYSAEDELQEDTSSQSKESKDESSLTSKVQATKTFDTESEYNDGRQFKATARSYSYLDEAQCEKNMDIFLKCIDSVANVTNQTGFAAIKLTALTRPKLLLKLSAAIKETEHLLTKDAQNGDSYLKAGTAALLKDLNENQRMLLTILSWNELISPQKVLNYFQSDKNDKSSTNGKTGLKSVFNAEEEEMFSNLIRRIETLARHAQKTDVRIMIDAEQTYLQPAINRITVQMMKKYNTNKCIVFNTYQCYLKSTFDTMLLDLNLSYKDDFYFGAKLVRGAYMEQERQRAKNLDYEDPINENFEATTAMYHKTLDHLMKEITKTADPSSKRIAIMVASHNEETVRFAVENMKKLSILPEHKVICFGQLYAMSDHISFTLGQSGYSVYKYVPYGPVDEVLPYLSRRAVENSSILTKASRERNLIKREIVRRMINGEWFYKPKGNYAPV